MRARLVLKPGQRGTKKLCAEYGERLLYVRYRYDEARRKRFKTVELVVDEVDWEPRHPKCSVLKNEEQSMSSMWYAILALIAISLHTFVAQQIKARRRRQMGPRVQVEPSEFLRIVEQEGGLVIEARKDFFQDLRQFTTYVSRCGDYYYYTVTREPLAFPGGCVVQQAKAVLL